jgi:hypothetical protein
MRGPERPYEKPANRFRILLLGDSQVDATMVETRERVGERLEQILNAEHPAKMIEVLSMGAGGYSTDQEMLWLESEGWKFSPDIVVLVFSDDDVSGNAATYFYGPKPRFLWDGKDLTLHNVPVPEGLAGRHSHEPVRWNLDTRLPAIHRWAENHSRLYDFLFVGWQRLTPRPAPSRLYRTPETQDVAAAWEVSGALLAHMNREANEKKSRLIIFYLPRRESVYRDDWAALKSRLHLPAQDWNMDLVAARLISICRAESLDCEDPTERFVAAAGTATASNRRLYNKYDTHWTAAGHRVAAKILAAKIRPEVNTTVGDPAH